MEYEKLYEKLKPASTIRRIELWKFIQDLKDKSLDEFGGWLWVQEMRCTSKIVRATDLWNYTVEGNEDGVKKIKKEIREGRWKVKE